MNTIVEMDHVTKTYRRKIKSGKGIFKSSKFETKEAIKDISFQIKEGEMVGIVGLNGAGKSTLIKSMLGILSPDSGEAKMFGRDSFQFRKKNAEYIGANFGQKSSLVWDLPFIYSLELNKKIYRVSDERYEEIIEELEQFLQIGELLNDIYHAVIRVAVSALIPIALANYYPTVCMLGEGSSGILLYIAGACVILGVIDVLVWKKGMKAYQSTGA